MRKVILIVSVTIASSILVILILFAFSNKDSELPGGFNRSIISDAITDSKAIDIRYNSYYLAGVCEDSIYLGNLMSPFHVLAVNRALTDTQYVQVTIRDRAKQKLTTNLRVKVNCPNFFITDGNAPALLKGSTTDWNAKRFMYDSLFFIDALPISHSSFAMRAVGISPRENVLAKESSATPHTAISYKLLERQSDGLFCTDGTLLYNKDMNNLIYLYTYRNQFLVIDTSLNLLNKAHTIDTNRIAKVRPASIQSANAHTLSAPATLVNLIGSVYDNLLFVNSAVLADNESKNAFREASVIDVYDLTTRQYKFSFYIPGYGKHKMRNFEVFENEVIALYDHHIISYQLNEKYFLINEDAAKEHFITKTRY